MLGRGVRGAGRAAGSAVRDHRPRAFAGLLPAAGVLREVVQAPRERVDYSQPKERPNLQIENSFEVGAPPDAVYALSTQLFPLALTDAVD